MSVVINIQGTPIEFPSSGESPNWAPAVIEFARAVEDAIASAVGPFDIAPQVISLPASVNTDLDITNLSFSILAVRAAFISYSLYLVHPTNGTVSEAGSIIASYDSNLPLDGKWVLSRDYVGSDTGAVFSMTDEGQMQITLNLTGYTSGRLSFSAKALEQEV